jgi:hypothetical protein
MSGNGTPSAGIGAVKSGRSLDRIDRRPTLDLWSYDEPMTLVEAVALDVTGGLLSMKGLRTAIKRGELNSKRINNRLHVTKSGVRELLTSHVSDGDETRVSVAAEDDQQEDAAAHDLNEDLMARIASERQRTSEHLGRRPN